MKNNLAVALILISVFALPEARADGSRCKIDSTGKVVPLRPSDLDGSFCTVIDHLFQGKKNNPGAVADSLKEIEFNDSGVGPNNGLIISSMILNRAANSPEADKLRGSFISAVEDSRVDEQVGAGSSSSGTTSLTSKGNVPAILGFAVENGALTQSQSGTTITFSGNPVGIIKTIAGTGYLQGYADDDRLTRHLRDLSFSVSFDTSRGNASGTFTGDAQQVSAYSFRYAILNHRDPRSFVYSDRWRALAYGSGRSATINQQSLVAEMAKNKAFQAWLDSCQTKMKDALNESDDQKLESKLEQVLSDQLFVELPKVQDQLSDQVQPLLNAYARSEAQFLSDRQAILDVASKGAIVTFEYVNERQIKSPDLSNFKLIAEGSAGAKVDLTGNLSFVVLNQIPANDPGASRLHDVKASAQMDIRAGNIVRIGSIVLSFSGMYERMRDNAIIQGGTSVPNTRGDIALGQFKVTIPVKGSGVRIPFSLTIANRTELIKESDVRGSVGITLDLDSLFAKANP